MTRYLFVLTLVLIAGCVSQPDALYQSLGGEAGIERISGQFIATLPEYPEVRRHFNNTDLSRFHEMFTQHLCAVAGGGCEYTGDDMARTHTGMNINTAEFNQVVECLIRAMEANAIPYPVQNQLLARLAPMRSDIIYR